MSSEKQPRRVSCAPYFDALWFCYFFTPGHPFSLCSSSILIKEGNAWKLLNSRFRVEAPVHQMQQYYRVGVLDNCSQKWSALFDCLTLKTKRSSEVEEILETREKAKPHLWSFRTPEEAASHWRELFDHLEEE